MDFLSCVSSRRSIRKFKPDPIGHDVINRIIEAVSFSPSWKNTQTARYTFVESEALKSELADRCTVSFPNNGRIIKGAPAVIVLSSIRNRSGYDRDGSFTTSKGAGWEMFDAGIAAQTLCLAACNEGLGTVIMGIFDENEVASVIGLDSSRSVSALIAIGYPDEQPVMPKRKDTSDLIKYR